MDIVTHGLTGLLAGRAATGHAWGRPAVVAQAGSLAPDLDLIAGFWDPLASLVNPR